MASFPYLRSWQVVCLMSGALLCASGIHMGEVEEHPHAKQGIPSERKGENNHREVVAEKATDAAVQAADAAGALRKPKSKSAKKAKAAKKADKATTKKMTKAEKKEDTPEEEDAAADAAATAAKKFGASGEEITKAANEAAADVAVGNGDMDQESAAGSGSGSAAGSGSGQAPPTPSPTTDRQLVKDGSGACDELELNGDQASCDICSLYADGRNTTGENSVAPEQVGSPCQFVPSEKLCYPEFWVKSENMKADTKCEDHDSKTSRERQDAPGKCDDVENPSCMICHKYKDGRKPPHVDQDETGSNCVYVASEDKCYPEFWVKSEKLEADTECEEERVAAQGKCDDVESPSCKVCNKFKDGRAEEDIPAGEEPGSPCQYDYSQGSCFPEWWVKSEDLETDTDCEADREFAVAMCDNVEEPSCEECNKFKDGRDPPNVGQNETGSPCQYVPDAKKCFPAFWVEQESLTAETSC